MAETATEQASTVRGYRLCPACGEVLKDGDDFCDDLCKSIHGNPKPTRESLRLFSEQMQGFEETIGDIRCRIEQARQVKASADRRYNGIQKARIARCETMEDINALRARDTTDGQSNAQKKSVLNRAESNRHADEIIRICENEQHIISDAMQWIRVNQQVESYDYDNYVRHRLPLPPERAAIYDEEEDDGE